jgi:4-diphosphocytidyl-2-C-methyl-D-erythritol kinase
MQALYDLPAPAKLNLFLHVTGRRADGYHLLQSVFMLIDLADTLHIEHRGSGVSREDIGANASATVNRAAHADTHTAQALPPEDLCVRAARALQAATGCTQGCHITLQKRIPQQAGMGGGSSDAATCLLALNRLWGLNLSLAQLAAIGLKLGADVPFFLQGKNAWVEGVGEQITPVPVPPQRFVLLKPPAGLDTRSVFADPLLKRDTETAIISGFATNAGATDKTSVFTWGHNDLEPVARRLCPEIGQALNHLQAQGLQARMTGSGSTVFAPLPRGFDASRLAAAPQGFWQQLCSNVQVHPLYGWVS